MKKIKIITIFLLAICIFEIAMLNSTSSAISYSQDIELQSEETLVISDFANSAKNVVNYAKNTYDNYETEQRRNNTRRLY